MIMRRPRSCADDTPGTPPQDLPTATAQPGRLNDKLSGIEPRPNVHSPGPGAYRGRRSRQGPIRTYGQPRPRPISPDRSAQGPTPRSLPENGHAPALQHRSIRADHPEEEVEGHSRPTAATAALELHCARTASRRGQRRDRNEIGARTDAVGRVDGPGNSEGGVRGGIVDVDLDLGIEIALPLTCWGNDDQAHTLPRHRRQGAHCAGRTGYGRGRRGHSRAGREQDNDQPAETTYSEHDTPLSLDLPVQGRSRRPH